MAVHEGEPVRRNAALAEVDARQAHDADEDGVVLCLLVLGFSLKVARDLIAIETAAGTWDLDL